MMNTRQKDLARLLGALEAAKKVYRSRSADCVHVEWKSGGDPVTDTERTVNQLLFEMLVRDGEGWLSEESADSDDRLHRSRVWLVDPLDGTREYVSGIPEWCISIALVEDGELMAGGICNPMTEEMFYGSRETGIVYECGASYQVQDPDFQSREPLTLASRSEVNRGEWERFQGVPFKMKPMGSVAYKLALVAAGKADATWTLVPKHEWDVAGGVALMLAAGGRVLTSEGLRPAFNKRNLLLPGVVALSQTGMKRLEPFFSRAMNDPVFQDCVPWLNVLKAGDPKP